MNPRFYCDDGLIVEIAVADYRQRHALRQFKHWGHCASFESVAYSE